MFDNIKLAMEKEAVRDAKHAIDTLKMNQYQVIAHHLSSILSATVAFILVLYSVVLFKRIEDGFLLLALSSLSLAVIVVFIHENNKRKPKYINGFLTVLMRLRIVWIKKWNADYLAKYYWISLAVLVALFLFLVGIFTVGDDGWVDKEAIQDNRFSLSINMLLTMALGLLAAQIALFSIMMQQVLGKYSGVVAQTVVSHRAIKTLMLYPFFGLVVLLAFYHYGFPKSIQNYALPTIGTMLLLGLFISVIVAKTGLRESLAIKYVGEADSRRLKKAMPPPINNMSRSSRYFWLPLKYFGLDFRNSERYQLMGVPKTGSSITIESLGTLLGVANKAIVDGQHDLFVASLASIERIMQSYAERRALYFGNEDSVFMYLNYQLAALTESAANAPNQYLISNLATSVGSLSRLTYCIGNYPDSDNRPEKPPTQSNNFTTSLWMGLLFQNFEHTHELTRSTAAHESIIQMGELVKTSIIRQDSDAITMSFLPTIKRVYGLCLLKLTDAYHQSLAGMCFGKLVSTLFYIAQYRDKLAGIHQDPFEETLNQISESSELYLTILPTGSLNLDDPINSLLSKTDKDKYCLQEIFFVTLNRGFSNRTDYSVAKSDMHVLIETNSKLGKFAVSQDVYLSGYYLDALFEMAYLVIRGLPPVFREYDDLENKERASYRHSGETEDTQRKLTILVFNNLRGIYVEFYQSKRVMPDWQQPALSVLGIAIVCFCNSGEVYLKEQIIKTSQLLYSLVADDYESGKLPRHGSKKYLQLLGAWLNHFGIDKDLADKIATLTAVNRGSKGMFGGVSGGRYGPYGYPTIGHNDFFLYPLRNIRHSQNMSETNWDEFEDWGDKLICDDTLLPYYSQIRAIP